MDPSMDPHVGPAEGSRGAILSAVRAALAGARVAPPGGAAGGAPSAPGARVGPPGSRPPPAEPRAVLWERFAARLASAGGVVHRAADGERAAALVARLARELGLTRLLTSDAPLALRIGAALEGVELLGPTAPREARLEGDGGLTTAQLAVAETGTLVLDHAAERSREASLLPPVHLCLVDARDVVATLGQALSRLGSPHAPTGISPAVTFVTGPSRTADIEMRLVVGVHGPRALHAVIVGG